jgi:cysteine desulfuration protein SufE
MSISENEQIVIDEFAAYDDWLDKYNLLVEMGKSLPVIGPQYKTDTYLISGCQSKVWLHAAFENGKIIFTADSDAIITKGIVNLLMRVLSNQSPDDILQAKLGFIDQIGLQEHLSPTRSNGLSNMVKQMKLYATVFKMKMAGKTGSQG